MPTMDVNPWIPGPARRGDWRLTAYEFLARVDLTRSISPGNISGIYKNAIVVY